MLVLIIYHLNSLAATTFVPPTKKRQFLLSIKINKQASNRAQKTYNCLQKKSLIYLKAQKIIL